MQILGLDIGTTTISAVVSDVETGTVVHKKTVPHHSDIQTDNEAERMQDPFIIAQICSDIVKEFVSKTDIDGIGLTGQMHGMLYVDSSGNALSPLATWQDGRGNLIYKDDMTYCEYITKITGCHVSTGYGIVSLFYDTVNGLIPEGTASLCTIMDYIAMTLAENRKPVIHPSNAASIGCFDIENNRFLVEKIRQLGISTYFLPEVTAGEKIIGLAGGTIPVAVAIGDNQASYLGSAGTSSSMLVNIGTGSQVSMVTAKPVYAEGLDCRPFIEGKYLLVGASLCGGSAYAILGNLFTEVLKLAGAEASANMYELMDKAAASAQGKHPVTETTFLGKRNDPLITGSIAGITPENFTAGHLAYSFMEGICRELKEFYEIMIRYVDAPKYKFMSGNALRNSRTERMILSEVFGDVFILAEQPEEAAFGASICAANILSK